MVYIILRKPVSFGLASPRRSRSFMTEMNSLLLNWPSSINRTRRLATDSERINIYVLTYRYRRRVWTPRSPGDRTVRRGPRSVRRASVWLQRETHRRLISDLFVIAPNNSTKWRLAGSRFADNVTVPSIFSCPTYTRQITKRDNLILTHVNFNLKATQKNSDTMHI